MTENRPERTFNPEGHSFKNVADKVRNGRLSNEVAWKEIQPLLANYVQDYPENYRVYSNLLREIFDIRRSAYFYPEKREKASTEVRNLLSSVEEEYDRDLLITPVVCIRDLFDVEAPRQKPRRF